MVLHKFWLFHGWKRSSDPNGTKGIAHTYAHKHTGMELSTFNHKLPYVSFIDPLWCRSEPGSTAFGESTCDGSKSSNAARVLC